MYNSDFLPFLNFEVIPLYHILLSMNSFLGSVWIGESGGSSAGVNKTSETIDINFELS